MRIGDAHSTEDAPSAALWENDAARAVLDSMADLFCALDRNFDIVFVNKSLADRGGHGESRYVGKNVWEVWPELRETEAHEALRTCVRTGIPTRLEFHHRPSGTWLNASGFPTGGYLHIYFRDVTEHRHAEARREALRHAVEAERLSHERLEAIFAQATVGIAVGTLDGTLLKANRVYEQIIGRTEAEIVNRSYLEITVPEDRNLNQELIGQLQRGETTSVTFRKRYLRPDGSFRWARVALSALQDSSGTPFNLVSVIEDITDVVAAEARESEVEVALRESERRQRLLVQVNDAIRNLTDPLAIAREACRLIREFTDASRCTYAVVHPERKCFEILENATQGVESVVGEYPITRFNKIFRVLSKGKPVSITDTETDPLTRDIYTDHYGPRKMRSFLGIPLVRKGTLIAILAVHRTERTEDWSNETSLLEDVAQRVWDAMERVRSENLVRYSEQRLGRILESATVGVIVNDVDGKFLYANPPLLRMLGYKNNDLKTGKLSWRKVQAPDRTETDNKALEQLRATGICDPYETEFLRKDGTRIPVYVGAAFVPNDFGSGELGAAFVTDLSELKIAEQKLMELNSQLDDRVRARTSELERANEEMAAFTYHVSHDLRAPLRAIVATSRILQEDFGDQVSEEAKQLLQRQIVAANKLGVLIDDLLKLSRLAKVEAHSEMLDLSAMCRELAEEHHFENEQIVVEIEEGMLAAGDPMLVRLLVGNLIGNAFRYSPAGGTVSIGRISTGHGRAFFVRDQGIGFDMQYAKKVFEPFERLVSDAEFPGSGVGLANAARIVEKHHGEIWAEAEKGRGATFFFTLG